MKKLSFLYSALLIASLGFMASCGGDDEPEPTTTTTTSTDPCAGKTFPTSNGKAVISFVNFPGAASTVNITSNAGDVLAIAVNILKGDGGRPQKLRVYESTCENDKGTQVAFPGQPQTEDGGKTVDLRNVDDQVRTVLYTIPTGKSPLYLTFEVDASNSEFTYKRLKITVSGSGIIDSWSNITLGAQSNEAASRMSSQTGYVYKACETEANINTIDITYASQGTGKSYLSSNPWRFEDPIGLTVKTRDCGTEGTIKTDGGNATYFAPATGVNFDSATDAELSALTVSNASPQYITVAKDGVYAFLNGQGKKGLVKVTAITEGAAGTATLSVKVQR